MVHEKQVLSVRVDQGDLVFLVAERDSPTEKVADRQRKVGVAGQKRVL